MEKKAPTTNECDDGFVVFNVNVDDDLGPPPSPSAQSSAFIYGVAPTQNAPTESTSAAEGVTISPPEVADVASKAWNCVETFEVDWEEEGHSGKVTRANSYSVIKELGSGSFGRVFEVYLN